MIGLLLCAWRLAKGHVTGHPLRTVLTLVGVSLGVAAPVGLQSANRVVLESFQEAVLEVAGGARLEVVSDTGNFAEDIIAPLRGIPEVVAAVPVLQEGLRHPLSGLAFSVLALDLLELEQIKPVRMRDDRLDSSSPRWFETDTVLLGRRLADRLGAQSGRELDLIAGIEPRRLVVAGILEGTSRGSSVWDDLAVMDIAVAQELFGRVGEVDRIELLVGAEQSLENIQRKVEALLPPSLHARRPAQRGEQVDAMIQAFRLNLLMLSLVGLLVGGFLIYNTLSFSVAQHRREIGILRAIGMTEPALAGLFLVEGAMFGMVGGVLGSILGLALADRLVLLVGRTVTDLYVAVSPGTNIAVDALPLFVRGLLLGTGFSLLGALGPSIEAARTEVVQALSAGGYDSARAIRISRHLWGGLALLGASAALSIVPPVGTVPVGGYLSVLLLLIGFSFLAPLLIHACAGKSLFGGLDRWKTRPRAVLPFLAVQTAGRSPGRNGVTVSALMIGLAIMVGVVLMIQSFRKTVEVWVDQTVVADLIVAPGGWPYAGHEGGRDVLIPRAWADRIAQTPGVEAVDTYRDLRIELAGRPRSIVARDLALHAQRSRYLFTSGDSDAILRQAIARRGVVISEVLATALHLNDGDEIVLPTPAGEQTVPVTGVFYDYATDGGKIVMDRSLFREFWGEGGATVVPVYLDPDADPEAVKRRLEAQFPGFNRSSPIFTVIKNAELRREILAIFDRTFALTYVLEVIAVLVGVLGIVNTLLTAVLERQREFATLRAMGAGDGQVTGLVLWEALYLGMIGAILGVASGLCLALLLVRVINKQSFGWTVQLLVSFPVLAQAVALAMGAALVAGYWPARWVSRQVPAEGLRYE
jgi:putative ABC transport system permease protein